MVEGCDRLRLSEAEAKRCIDAVHDDYFETHRGAVRTGRGTAFVFFNDGHHARGDTKGIEATRLTRAALTGDGWQVGPVVHSGGAYSTGFEAAPPSGVDIERAIEDAAESAWEGYALAREETARAPDEVRMYMAGQRGIAESVTNRVSLASVL